MESRRSIPHLSVFVQLCALCLLPGIAGRAADTAKGEAAVVLRGVDGKTIRLTRADLMKLPRTEVEAVDHHGQKARYSGVALRVILDKLNVPRGEGFRGEWMRAFLVVDATDDYRALFALPELDPSFTDRVIILADMRDGKPLEKYSGPFRIVVPGEKKQARWVRMVKEIDLVDSRTLQKQ
jgi:Oxidoreductase molybdopterin binding domain